jgi:hypothetical protein
VLIGAAASKVVTVICILMQEGNTPEQLLKLAGNVTCRQLSLSKMCGNSKAS